MTTRLLICGVGRCGSSLTMQMLNAAGYRVPMPGPYHEMNELDRSMPEWWDRYDAVKWLNPGQWDGPGFLPQHIEWRCLWLAREVQEQAKSWVKFRRAHGREKTDGDWYNALIHVATQTAAGVHAASKVSHIAMPVLSFESILRDPEWAASVLLMLLDHEQDDETIAKMAAVVRKRSIGCAADMQEGLHPEPLRVVVER